jgi:MFS family permease
MTVAAAGRFSRRSKVFLGGQAVSLLGDGFAILAIPLLVLELTRNPLISAVSAASLTIGYLAVGLPAGVLVDRFDAWRVLITMDLARAGLFALLYVLSVTGSLTIPVILTIALLAAACHVFFETALVVVVKDMFAATALIRANAAIELASQMALVLGPAAIGVLIAFGGLQLALLINALSFAVSLLTLIGVRPRAAVYVRPTAEASAAQPCPRLPSRCPLPAFGTAAGHPDRHSGRGEPVPGRGEAAVLLRQGHARPCPDQIGIAVAAGGVGGILGALTAPRLARRFGHIRVVAVAIPAAGLAIGSIGLASSFLALSLIHLTYIWILIVASLVIRTLRQAIVPRELLGRVTSTVTRCGGRGGRHVLAVPADHATAHARGPGRAATPAARTPDSAAPCPCVPTAAPPSRALDIDQARQHPVLPETDRAWLTERARALVDAFAATDFPLGTGLVHADAHGENLVRHNAGWVLIDWDQTCLGPRELDLLAGLPDHFQEPEADRAAFLAAIPVARHAGQPVSQRGRPVRWLEGQSPVRGRHAPRAPPTSRARPVSTHRDYGIVPARVGAAGGRRRGVPDNNTCGATHPRGLLDDFLAIGCPGYSPAVSMPDPPGRVSLREADAERHRTWEMSGVPERSMAPTRHVRIFRERYSNGRTF